MRVAVIGAGRWGRLHARKLAAQPGVRLVAVVERDPGRARAAVAELRGVRLCATIDELPGGVEAVTVAVEPAGLGAVTERLLERDLHVLTEKPLATEVTTAERLTRLAASRRRVLAVGYLERFNPALSGCPARPLAWVARRVGPPGRLAGRLDLDWLVHDLDLALHRLGPSLRVVEARWRADEIRLSLVGEGGRRARLTVSAGAPRTRRRLWVDGARLNLAGGGDPLGAQLAAFVAASSGRPAPTLARGEDAVRALRLLEAARALGTAAAA